MPPILKYRGDGKLIAQLNMPDINRLLRAREVLSPLTIVPIDQQQMVVETVGNLEALVDALAKPANAKEGANDADN